MAYVRDAFPTNFPAIAGGPAVTGIAAWTRLPKQPTTTPAAPAASAPLAQQSQGVPLAGTANVTSHLLGGMFGAVPVRSPQSGTVPIDLSVQNTILHHATADHPMVPVHPPAHGTAIMPIHSPRY